ncbi:MAG TPA: hypothetical protein VFM37_17770 [Pseudonocardiaceae bacterium]|nr:hypothetical protein [Pseudonocardiaceae bacterium]
MTIDRTRRRIDRLPPGEIHAVGAAGLETASMVRYLVEAGRDDIVLHDRSGDFDYAIDMAHRLQPPDQVARTRTALAGCRELRAGPDYLAGVESAVTVLAPVSWFLAPANARLVPLQDRFVYFPDACFDLWRGSVIGVTGSFGKTTTTRFAAALTGGVACGNDREFCCDLAALAAAPADARMAFEASNRHLRNGFRRVLDVGVLTGITLNHEPDHGSFEAYRRVKYSMADRCRDFLYHAAIPAAFPDAAVVAERGTPYGGGGWRLVEEVAVDPGGGCWPVPGVAGLSPVDQDNALAAVAAAAQCGVSASDIQRRSGSLAATTPRYRHSASVTGGRLIINDAASCTPASTEALVRRLDQRFALICGGDRQRYREGEFRPLAAAVAANPHAGPVYTIGPMAGHLTAALQAAGFRAVARAADLDQAVERALREPATTVVFSPGCGTGAMFADKYVRGEAFDDAVTRLVSAGQTTP